MHGTSEREGAPTVSDILSVKNGGRDLPQVIGTILNQTFSNFELIAINNGSTDDTRAYLDSIPDPRPDDSVLAWFGTSKAVDERTVR
jgi:glycosyltransferase involved in cell wall biosynthesis